MKLYIVRHGEVERAGEVIYGQADLPLSARGREQAAHAARWFSGRKPEAIYCSDLSRTAEHARLIAGAHDMLPVPDARWREIDMGEIENTTRTEAVARFPEFARMRYHDIVRHRFPRGESIHDVAERVNAALDELVARHRDDRRVILVTHNSVGRIALARFLCLPLEEGLRRFSHRYGTISCIEFPPPGSFNAVPGDPVAGDDPRVLFMGLQPWG